MTIKTKNSIKNGFKLVFLTILFSSIFLPINMSDESSEPLEQTLHRVVVRLALSLEVNEYSYISLEMREKETIDFICSALSSLDPQFDLVNFFGYDYIEEISVIIQNSEYFMKYFKNRRECSDELDYVEYTIPPANLIPINEDELVSTNILGNNSKYFQYNKFNQVQSKVFESVWRTNENILLAAPTGSGKTDVALLAIIKMLTEIKSGAEFRKVIYIAPMKALAAEITKKYNKILAEDRFRVVEYTGDTKREVENVNGADVIICTPEKLDAASRRLSMAITGIRLVIIDEIHLLGERRGAILESLILRLRAISESNQTSIRIIGLSATLPNYKDVGQFIRAAKTFHFDGRYRPVPLTTKIVGFKKRTSQKRRNEYLIKVLAELKKKGKQALIFVSSRAKTTQVAKLISDELQNETAYGIYSYKPINSTKTIKEADLHKMISQLSVSSGQLNTATGSHMNANGSHPSAHISNRLQHFISRRIGIHHAGMPRHERSTVELLFLNSHLDFLVCTSTLAWGVNLPAHAVIIFGTSFYDSSLGSFSQLGILDVVQIFGRAGRPQFDTLGLSYLITDSSHTDMYMSRLKETQPIESHLLFHIVDALSSEIYLKNITDLPSALAWLKDTFLYIRMQHNPSAYGNNQFNNPSLINLIKIAMQRLQASCMLNVMHSNVTHTDILNSNIYSSTFYGRIAAIYCTSYLTLHTWLTLLQSSSVIDLLLACDELTVINIRPDEESDINKIAQQLVLRRILDIEYDNSLQSKLIILFYALINYIDMPSYTLRCDTQYMIDAFDRIIPCLYQLLVYNKKYNEIKELLIYNNKINYTASRQTNRTSNQTSITAIKTNRTSNQASITAIKAIRIGMFVDLKIDIKNSTRNTIYILIYKDGIITHTSKINNGYREIIKANESEIEIEIYGVGRVMKNKVKIEEDYSLHGLYRYGMHSCDGIFRLSGHKEECMHMRSEDESITKSINYNNSIINITQLINNIESFNNLILINYKLNIKMIEIGYLDIKEELSEVDYRIAEIDEEYIYVCESEKIAKNVASKLTRIRGIRGKYEQVEHAKQINENTTKLLTIGYEKIINEKNTGRRRIIMRGCRKRGEYYAVGEILKICDGRESIIYERKEFIEYMEKIIEK